MLTKFLTLALIGLVINMACATSVPAATTAEKETRFAEKVKANIAKLGTGPQARIEVNLRDHRKLKGYVSEVNDAGFVVMDDKTGTATPVAYPQVKQAKGNNLSSNVKLAIALGALLFAIIVVAAAKD